MQKLPGKYRHFLQIACLLSSGTVLAQVTPYPGAYPAGADTLPPTPLPDSLPPISFRDSATVDLSKIKISNDALDDVVEYEAADSMWFDVKNKQVHLYGEASVKYTTLNIKAGYILLDYANSEISAQQFADSTGQLIGLPDFKDGEQQFTASRLRYNFKTKKGIIYEARTQQEDLYVLGGNEPNLSAENRPIPPKKPGIQFTIKTHCSPPAMLRTRTLGFGPIN